MHGFEVFLFHRFCEHDYKIVVIGGERRARWSEMLLNAEVAAERVSDFMVL